MIAAEQEIRTELKRLGMDKEILPWDEMADGVVVMDSVWYIQFGYDEHGTYFIPVEVSPVEVGEDDYVCNFDPPWATAIGAINHVLRQQEPPTH